MKIDYHIHALGHLEFAHTRAHLEQVLKAAQQAGLQEIGLADHDEYAEHFRLSLVQEVAAGFPGLQVRQGVEVDYRPEREGTIRHLIGQYEWDYIMGSVHYLNGWPFDHPDWQDGYKDWDPDELYRAYYSTVAQAADTGLFDIIGHLDLIKVFGCRPVGDRLALAEPALTAIRDCGICVEVNTNGWYKPVQEVYPELLLLQECRRLGIPVTTGSDAHTPGQIGRDLDRAGFLLKEAGYETVTIFQKRQPQQMAL